MEINKIILGFLICGFLLSCKNEKPSELVNQTEKRTEEEANTNSTKPTNSPAAEPTDKENAPVLTFAKTEHDFGTIPYGEKATHNFAFTNTGKSTLIIKDVKPSCGCTVPNKPKEPFAPGASGEIEVVYNPKNHNGTQGSSVSVLSNGVKGNETLRIKANIKNAPGKTNSAPKSGPGLGPVKTTP